MYNNLQITPIKAYQTTDGKIFTGKLSEKEADAHQKVINTVNSVIAKSRIPENLKWYSTRSSCGLLTAFIYHTRNKLKLIYVGNMGSSMKNVEECIYKLFFGTTLKRLKQVAKKVEEKGSPDYMWEATFYF